MSKESRKNNIEILNILMGYAQSTNFLKKSLWWITRELEKNKNKLLIVDDGECGDIEEVINYYITRINYKVIKIDNKKLKKVFGIDSLNESKNLGFKICEKFSSNKKIFISPRTICYNYNFNDFVNNINDQNIIQMNTYLIPNYVQEAITEFSSNFCNLLASECKKFPLYTEEYPAKTSDFIVKSFVGEENGKQKVFLNQNCFYLETDKEIESDKIQEIDDNLIEDILI